MGWWDLIATFADHLLRYGLPLVTSQSRKLLNDDVLSASKGINAM